MQSTCSLNTISLQSEHNQPAVWTQSTCNVNTTNPQSEYNQPAVWTQSNYSLNTINLQSEHRQSITVCTQSTCSPNTIKLQSENTQKFPFFWVWEAPLILKLNVQFITGKVITPVTPQWKIPVSFVQFPTLAHVSTQYICFWQCHSHYPFQTNNNLCSFVRFCGFDPCWISGIFNDPHSVDAFQLNRI